MVPLAILSIVAGCSMPGQNTAARPEPGDNQMKIEIEASQTTKNAVTNITEHIRVKVNAVNGDGEPLIGDDFKPLTQWDSGRTITYPGKPWAMILSQPVGQGGNAIVAAFQIYPESNAKFNRTVDIKCHFFIKRFGIDTDWVEDKPKLQVGTGAKVTCLYSVQFPG
jgi:hypothetical protein